MNLFKKGIRNFFKAFGLKIQRDIQQREIFTGASRLLELDYGHLESRNTQTAIDGQNKPIPWFTYPAIEYFRQLDLSGKVMLEWGAGNSSLFFSKRVKQLYSIEHNKDWYETTKGYRIENQTLILAEENYAKVAIDTDITFDVILIDGIEREECSKVAINLLNEGGLIILDNSDRHPDVAEFFRQKGLIEVDFHGLGPINNYTWTTSIFMERSIDLKPLSIQPTIPLGGGY